MIRSGLEGFGRRWSKEDEIVVEATCNARAGALVLRRYVARAIAAIPLQVKAIARNHVKTDKMDAGVLASTRAAGFLPKVWLPDADTEYRRRLVARRNQVVRHRTRIKNEVYSRPAGTSYTAVPACRLVRPAGSELGLADRNCQLTEQAAIERHLRELDRLGEYLDFLDRDSAEQVIEDPSVQASPDHHRHQHQRGGRPRRRYW